MPHNRTLLGMTIFHLPGYCKALVDACYDRALVTPPSSLYPHTHTPPFLAIHTRPSLPSLARARCVGCCYIMRRTGHGPRSDEASDGFDMVGKDIVRRFEADEALKITVLTLMGKDIVMLCVPDPGF